MKTITAAVLLSLLASPASAKLRVVATTQDLAAIAREIGGEHVEVEAIAKGYQDPHFVAAKPSYLLKLKRADLFIQVGRELEVSWAPPLLLSARNRKILPGGAGYLDASAGCDVLEAGAAADRSQGDVHPSGNPHYWLDPANGRIIAGNIAEKLSLLAPESAGDFRRNLKSFEAALASKEKSWEALTAGFVGTKVVTYHNSWPNFMRRFKFKVINYVEPKPGIPASPAHVRALIEQIRREQVPLLIMEPYFDDKLARKIAAETGIRIVVLPPSVGAVPEVRTYFDLFDHDLKLLAEALKPGGRRP